MGTSKGPHPDGARPGYVAMGVIASGRGVMASSQGDGSGSRGTRDGGRDVFDVVDVRH